MDYGSSFHSLLRAEAGPAWTAYVEHAFVRGLEDGTLPRASFLHYLQQDYVYLIHYTRAWALAAAKSTSVEEMREFAGTALTLIDGEMQLHIETCKAVGISQSALEATREEPENLAYTRFVVDAGQRGDLLDLLAALIPCALGYGEIGARLMTTTETETDTFGPIEVERQVLGRAGPALARQFQDRLGNAAAPIVRALGIVKRAAAETNMDLGKMDPSSARPSLPPRRK
jgi:thiaminase/transcriptional activator TenA